MPTNEELIITSARVMQHESRLGLIESQVTELLVRVGTLEAVLALNTGRIAEIQTDYLSDRAAREDKFLEILDKAIVKA